MLHVFILRGLTFTSLDLIFYLSKFDLCFSSGKSPLIVMDDVDVAVAAKIAHDACMYWQLILILHYKQ